VGVVGGDLRPCRGRSPGFDFHRFSILIK
jgi:hypothetical protein